MARTKLPMYYGDEAGPSHVRQEQSPQPPPPNDWRMEQIKKRPLNQETPFSMYQLRNTPIPQQVVEMGWHRLADKKP